MTLFVFSLFVFFGLTPDSTELTFFEDTVVIKLNRETVGPPRRDDRLHTERSHFTRQ